MSSRTEVMHVKHGGVGTLSCLRGVRMACMTCQENCPLEEEDRTHMRHPQGRCDRERRIETQPSEQLITGQQNCNESRPASEKYTCVCSEPCNFCYVHSIREECLT